MREIKMRNYLFVLLIGMLFHACNTELCCPPDEKSDPDLVNIEPEVLIDSLERFSFKSFKHLVSEEDKSDNIIISPLSLVNALYMTYNGANSDTRSAMAKALSLNIVQPESLNKAFSESIERLSPANDSVELVLANAVFWDENRLQPNDFFLEQIENHYQAALLPRNFLGDLIGVTEEINQWVKENTNGKIEKIIDNLNPDEVMFLVNALYFKGSWKNPFDPYFTIENTFTTTQGETIEANYLNAQRNWNAVVTDRYSGVALDFADPNFVMYFLLPAINISIDDFILDFDLTSLMMIVNQNFQKITFSCPFQNSKYLIMSK